MSSISEIYALSLYAQGEGWPLWHPTPCRLADVGYMRDGTFHRLYNAKDGPQSTTLRSEAADVDLARRTEADTRSAGPSSPARESQAKPSGLVLNANAGPSSDHKMADVVPSHFGDHLERGGESGASSPSFHHQFRRPSWTRSSEPPQAPLPLKIDEAPERVFGMGPRMSANITAIGASIGADASFAAAPVGATLSFETSGGDGALLITRDPTHRQLLLHVGILKTYVKTHQAYIYNTFGPAEDLEPDDVVFIYGQDLTSDWACAVNREAARGARVEFEVFSAAKLGVWGDWKTKCSASQRGPHRDASQYIEDAPSPASTSTEGDGKGHSRRGSTPKLSWQAHGDLNAGPASVGISVGNESASTSTPEDTSLAAIGAEGQAGAATSEMPIPERPGWSWAKTNPFIADQSVILKRITTKRRLMFPWSIQAGAGPRTDCDGGKDDDSTSGGAGAGASSNRPPHMPLDPVEVVHEYLWTRGTNVSISIVAEDEAVQLVRKVLETSTWQASTRSEFGSFGLWIRAKMFEAADQITTVQVDDDGVALLAFTPRPQKDVMLQDTQNAFRAFPRNPLTCPQSLFRFLASS